MRKRSSLWVICSVAFAFSLRGADDSMPMIAVPIAPVAARPASRPGSASSSDVGSEAAERVAGWIRERVPGCPAEASRKAAAAFVAMLRDRNPERADHLLDPDFSIARFESMLFRCTAETMPDAPYESIRRDLAVRRVDFVLSQRGGNARPGTASSVLQSIRALSETRYQSLIDGHMDDDDLAFYVDRVAEKPAEHTPAVDVGPTANSIAAEFARHNQVGAALRDLQAYLVEARLKAASGAEQRLLLLKMRPDRFRLSVATGEGTQFVQVGDGGRYWQEIAGGATQSISATQAGNRKYLAEFLDPLFGEEGYAFKRLPDGGSGDDHFLRISIERSDGSKYVAQIDPRTYHEVGREEEDGSVTRYSDFRVIAGVTFPFREEVSDRMGRKGVLEILRVLPNPGIVRDMFRPPAHDDAVFFAVDRLLASAAHPQTKGQP